MCHTSSHGGTQNKVVNFWLTIGIWQWDFAWQPRHLEEGLAKRVADEAQRYLGGADRNGALSLSTIRVLILRLKFVQNWLEPILKTMHCQGPGGMEQCQRPVSLQKERWQHLTALWSSPKFSQADLKSYLLAKSQEMKELNEKISATAEECKVGPAWWMFWSESCDRCISDVLCQSQTSKALKKHSLLIYFIFLFLFTFIFLWIPPVCAPAQQGFGNSRTREAQICSVGKPERGTSWEQNATRVAL